MTDMGGLAEEETRQISRAKVGVIRGLCGNEDNVPNLAPELVQKLEAHLKQGCGTLWNDLAEILAAA